MRLAGFFQHQTQRLDHAAHGELRPAQANGHSRPELNLDATQPHRLGRAVAFFLAVAFNLLPGRSGQGHRQRFESLIGGQLADAIDLHRCDLPREVGLLDFPEGSRRPTGAASPFEASIFRVLGHLLVRPGRVEPF